MVLRFQEKTQVVDEMCAQVNAALSVVLADYKGLTVAQVTELRKEARRQNVQLRVIRNTLAKRAFKGGAHNCLCESLTGPTLMALSREELGLPARVLSDFSKDNSDLKIRALSVDGVFREASEASWVAKLPTREAALAQLMGIMMAPLQKLVQTVNEVPAKLVRTVSLIQKTDPFK